MAELYHFTCDHGKLGIDETGMVKPNWHIIIGFALSWFTDLAQPDADAVGLTSETLSCDRLAHRYRVIDTERLKPWLGSMEQARTDPHVQADLHRYSTPEHWWIARETVRVTLDNDYAG